MISTAPLYNPAKYGKAESITWMSLQHAVAMLSLTTSPPPSKIFTSALKIQSLRQHLLLTCEEDLEEID